MEEGARERVRDEGEGTKMGVVIGIGWGGRRMRHDA